MDSARCRVQTGTLKLSQHLSQCTGSPDPVGRKRNAASGTPHLHEGALACLQHRQGVGIAGTSVVLICSLQLQLPLSPRKEAACAAFHDKKISSSGRPELPRPPESLQYNLGTTSSLPPPLDAGILRPTSSMLPRPRPIASHTSHAATTPPSLPLRTPLGRRMSPAMAMAAATAMAEERPALALAAHVSEGAAGMRIPRERRRKRRGVSSRYPFSSCHGHVICISWTSKLRLSLAVELSQRCHPAPKGLRSMGS